MQVVWIKARNIFVRIHILVISLLYCVPASVNACKCFSSVYQQVQMHANASAQRM